jgi:hypothetical protein
MNDEYKWEPHHLQETGVSAGYRLARTALPPIKRLGISRRAQRNAKAGSCIATWLPTTLPACRIPCPSTKHRTQPSSYF